MTVLSDLSIAMMALLDPLVARTVHEETGTSYGLSACGYDIRLDQGVTLRAGVTTLASSLERFEMRTDVVGIVHDKSTWARRGLSVQNTVIEPGWRGFLTLELLYMPLRGQRSVLDLVPGTPIAQVIFHRLDRPSHSPYDGKYQDQERGPQEAR